MILKKQAESGERNGVTYLNGKVQFQGVSLNVYSYLVDGVLIDTGSQSLHKFFERFIDSADFDQVLLTHYHEDHSGCAAYIEKTRNVPIYLNEKTIASCAQRANYPLYRKLFWGKRKPFHAAAMPETVQSRTASWDVIDTPGHAHDHKSFFNRETGQLFTGDLFVSERTKVVLAEEHIPDIIQSLDLVLTYDFQDVFCSHAGFLENGRRALERKKDYLQSLQQQVKELQKAGDSAEAIRDKLFPQKYPIIKFSGGEWDSLHIVTSLMSDGQLCGK